MQLSETWRMLRSPPWRSLSSFRSLAVRGLRQLLDVPKLIFFRKTTVKLVKVQAQLQPALWGTSLWESVPPKGSEIWWDQLLCHVLGQMKQMSVDAFIQSSC